MDESGYDGSFADILISNQGYLELSEFAHDNFEYLYLIAIAKIIKFNA